MTAKLRRKTSQAPKGRNKTAQGNALGNADPGNQSPVGAAQISSAARHSGWRNTNLGAVITSIDTGKSFRCEERPPTESEVGVVKVSAVTWGTYDEEESKTCLDAARIEPRYLIEGGDFLFSRANTIQLIGACVIAGAPARRLMLSDKILRFRFTNDVVPKWVLHWLRSKQGRSEIERLSSGNQESMRNIGQERIRAIALPLPPPEDQRRIVAEIEKQFTRLEAGVAALRRLQANLKRYRAAVLKAACEGKLAEGDRTNWQSERLGQLVTIRYGKMLPTKEFSESGFPVFGANGIIGYHTRYLYETEQVLISCRGAYSGKLNLSPPKCYITNNSLVLEMPERSRVEKRFLLYVLQAADKSKLVTGSAQPQVTINNADALEVPVPPLAEQTRIVAEVERRLSVVEELEAVVTTNLQRATRLRQSVLQMAFTGELI